MNARNLMTSPVIVVEESTTLEQAARLMLEKGIGCLPVVDSHGSLKGILTESDFAGSPRGIPFSLYKFPQVFGEYIPRSGVESMFAAARSRTVGEFMTRALVTVAPDSSVEDVMRTMQRSRHHRLPVVEEGRPIGIISRHNLLQLMVSTLGPKS